MVKAIYRYWLQYIVNYDLKRRYDPDDERDVVLEQEMNESFSKLSFRIDTSTKWTINSCKVVDIHAYLITPGF